MRTAQDVVSRLNDRSRLKIDETCSFSAVTAFRATSSPTHIVSSLTSSTVSRSPGFPRCGFADLPGRNWPVPMVVQQHSVYSPGPGYRPAPAAKMAFLHASSPDGGTLKMRRKRDAAAVMAAIASFVFEGRYKGNSGMLLMISRPMQIQREEQSVFQVLAMAAETRLQSVRGSGTKAPGRASGGISSC